MLSLFSLLPPPLPPSLPSFPSLSLSPSFLFTVHPLLSLLTASLRSLPSPSPSESVPGALPGNFQCREKMRVEKQVRLRYGRFFYRFADGESAADVYDRVTGVHPCITEPSLPSLLSPPELLHKQDMAVWSTEEKPLGLSMQVGVQWRHLHKILTVPSSWLFGWAGFRETLRADIEVGRFQRNDFSSRNMNIVLVSHGLTLRVFLMRWYKWSVQQFEGLYNFDNAEPLVMQRGEHGR